jgi:hypothetical protein
MEVCPEPERIILENTTALHDGALKIGERGEVPVREWLVENRPKVLGRLKLGRMAGQVDKPEPIRHDQLRLARPAGVVEPKHNNPILSRASLARKQRQERGEERFGDAVRHVPEGLARGRLHESRHIEPLVAVMAERNRPLALGRPDPT